MGELTSEWCRMKAAEWKAMRPNPSESMADARQTAAALTIAARVLDEGAVEGVARVITRSAQGDVDPDKIDRDGLRTWENWAAEACAVLAYLKGEVE